MNVFHRKINKLFAIGFLETNSGAFSLFDKMSHLLVNYINERESQSVSASKFETLMAKDEPDLSGGINYIKSSMHANYVNKNTYLNYIVKLHLKMGWKPLESLKFKHENHSVERNDEQEPI